MPEYNIGSSDDPEETLLILALDTTTRAGSIAVGRDGEILADITGDPALKHGQRLPLDLARALDLAGAATADIDLLAVTVGPGSFTGLRVGIATVQGLAAARNLRIVPVSTLEALAHEARRTATGDSPIGAWVDAQRGEVFAALYEADGITAGLSPTSATPERTLDAWRDTLGTTPVVFSGDGAVRYRDVILAAFPDQAQVVVPAPALAAAAARIAAAHPERAVAPHAVVPVYIRRSDAEILRDRRAAAAEPVE
jgi:tRNA threonylcarbamoyladenosine biosynthesis protein TsaB